MFAMYLIGITTAVFIALIFKRTVLKGKTPPFVMELPGYKIPSPRTVLSRMVENGWSFLRGAGTLIVAVTVVVWAAGYFPRDPAIEQQIRAASAQERSDLEAGLAEIESRDDRATDEDARNRLAALERDLADLDRDISNQIAAANIQQSFLGRAGRLIEPAVRPLGWDWRIGCAVIASFPAREVVIGTLSVIYHLGEGQDQQSESLRETLQSATSPETGQPTFNTPVALSIMVFYALCAQCAATLAMIRRETSSWRWPLFTFAYMTTLAYLGALATYRIGMLFVS